MTKHELTKAELEIMQILWKVEKAFVADILALMPDPKPAYNTVSTIIRILEKKRVVAYEAFGRSHRYYSLISKEEYTQGVLQGVMKNFFDNSPAKLLSFFSEKENLSAKEFEEIITIARRITGDDPQK